MNNQDIVDLYIIPGSREEEYYGGGVIQKAESISSNMWYTVGCIERERSN